MMSIIDDIRTELISYRRNGIPAIIHPGNALALARRITGVPTLTVAEAMGISRTYLEGFENHSRQISQSSMKYFNRLTRTDIRSNNSEMNSFMAVYKDLLPSWDMDLTKTITYLCRYTSSLEKSFKCLESIDMLKPIFYKAFSMMPDFVEVFWGKEDFANKEDNFPRMILTTPKSQLVAWAAGLLSTAQLVQSYTTKKALPPIVLMDRKQEMLVNSSFVATLAIFLFTEVNITWSADLSVPRVSVTFRDHRIDNCEEPCLPEKAAISGL